MIDLVKNSPPDVIDGVDSECRSEDMEGDIAEEEGMG